MGRPFRRHNDQVHCRRLQPIFDFFNGRFTCPEVWPGVDGRRYNVPACPMAGDERMTEPDVDQFVRRAEAVYAARLLAVLEPEHIDEFVAIEPESGDYFLGKTLNEATRAARQAHPDRLTHVMRVGHKAALHFGMHVR